MGLDNVLKKEQQVAAVLSGLAPMAGQISTLVTGAITIALVAKKLIQSVAKNADGTPITDAQFAEHLAKAEASVQSVRDTATSALSEDEQLKKP